jgi:hypothetical protein
LSHICRIAAVVASAALRGLATLLYEGVIVLRHVSGGWVQPIVKIIIEAAYSRIYVELRLLGWALNSYDAIVNNFSCRRLIKVQLVGKIKCANMAFFARRQLQGLILLVVIGKLGENSASRRCINTAADAISDRRQLVSQLFAEVKNEFDLWLLGESRVTGNLGVTDEPDLVLIHVKYRIVVAKEIVTQQPHLAAATAQLLCYQ